MKILCTGSAGFMGSWIAEDLVRRGHQVAGADSFQGGRNQVRGVPILVGDLSDGHFARYVADAAPPEILVHLAADAHEGASFSRPDSVTRNNLSAFASILEACIRKKTLRRVVVFSSMSVYGAQTPPFTEDMLPSPVDPYGVNKAAMEALARQVSEAHGLEWVVIRPHNVFGERQFCSDLVRNVIGIFMNKALRGEPLLVYGDGEQTRAFSYIVDSMPCYIRAVETPSVVGHIVNIGGEVPVTLNDVVRAIQVEFPGTQVEHIPDRYGEVKHAFSKHDKARELLGFEERIGWREGIHRMAEWAKANGPWEWEPILVQVPTKTTPKHWASQLWE